MLKEYLNRYIDENGNVFRKTKNGLVLCSTNISKKGYRRIGINNKLYQLHRFVWEAFYGSIPENMQIDHINTDRLDNRICNLRCVNAKENMRNLLTVKHKSANEFALKFIEHFNIFCHDNRKLYSREYVWFKRHGKCRWEV